MPYVPQSSACTVPNSADPVSQAAIAQAQARIAREDQQAGRALRDWMALIDRSPEDFADLNMPPGEFNQPQSAASLLNLPGANSASPGAPGDILATAASVAKFRASAVCREVNAPQVGQVQGGFKTAPVPFSLVTQPLGPPPAAVAPRARSQAECRSGSICRDLRDGCVLASQVDPRQLLICAQRGWSGNRNLYPWVAATPNLPFLGFPDPDPPAASGLGCADCGGKCGGGKRSCAGMGDDNVLTGGPGSSVLWGSLAAGAFVLYLAFGNKPRAATKKRSR